MPHYVEKSGNNQHQMKANNSLDTDGEFFSSEKLFLNFCMSISFNVQILESNNENMLWQKLFFLGGNKNYSIFGLEKSIKHFDINFPYDS